jgi:nicotinamide riboside kinase
MIIINFFAGAGSGKSTTAAALFSYLKMTGLNCELVTEFAKDLTWDESTKVLGYQPYVFGQQAWRLERLSGKVDVVVTDSPLLLSLAYSDPLLPICWKEYVLWEHNRYPSINFFIHRNKKYHRTGRNQTYDEAVMMDNKILQILQDENITLTEILTGDGTSAIKAFAKVSSNETVAKLIQQSPEF